MQGYEQGSQNQGNCAEQLNHHVERGASCILERITDGIANHACLVRFTVLTQNSSGSVEAINHFALGIHTQVTSLDIFLGIVPRASTVVQESCNDNTTHCSDHQQTCFGLRAEDRPHCNGSQYSYKAG